MAKKVKRKTTTNAEKAKKKARFQQNRNQMANVKNKMYTAYTEQMREREDLIRRATIIEGILSARPEIAIEKDGVLVLNEETTYLNPNDNIVYWKADNNPICSGLAEFADYPKYSPDFFNKVFAFISMHKPKQTENVTDVDLGDFDLVEDEEFTESSEVVDETIEIKDIPLVEEKIKCDGDCDECECSDKE